MEEGSAGSQRPDFSDLRYVGRGEVVGEDASGGLRDLGAAGWLAAVEADDHAVLGEGGGKCVGVARIPALQDLLIERAKRRLIGDPGVVGRARAHVVTLLGYGC